MAEVICSSLSRRFGGVWALSDVSCEVPSGGAMLVVGPSGSGKTTLLRLIAGLLRPDHGSVRIGSRLVTGPNVMIPPHRRGIAFVFQRPTLWPHMTALDNVALALVGRGLRRRERRARAGETLDRLDMSKRRHAYPATLSGGETQRVGLARALTGITDEYKKPLREAGLLTRDARKVEPKKYGRRKARKSEQYSKR